MLNSAVARMGAFPVSQVSTAPYWRIDSQCQGLNFLDVGYIHSPMSPLSASWLLAFVVAAGGSLCHRILQTAPAHTGARLATPKASEACSVSPLGGGRLRLVGAR